jgi:hypothetical protein
MSESGRVGSIANSEPTAVLMLFALGLRFGSLLTKLDHDLMGQRIFEATPPSVFRGL